MELRKIQFILLLIGLCSCGPAKIVSIPTMTNNPTPTNSSRWILYEKALSKAILGSEGGLCEWEIYGVSNSNREVYVWALCQFRGVNSRAGSVPAVIYLGDNGEIIKVIFPRDGTFYGKDIRVLFPPDIHAKILAHDFDASGAMKNIDTRRNSTGLPLIVTSGTSLP